MRKFVAHPTTVVKAFTNPWDMNDEDLEDYENSGYDDDQMVRCPYCTQLTSREIVRKYGMCWDCYDNNVE